MKHFSGWNQYEKWDWQRGFNSVYGECLHLVSGFKQSVFYPQQQSSASPHLFLNSMKFEGTHRRMLMRRHWPTCQHVLCRSRGAVIIIKCVYVCRCVVRIVRSRKHTIWCVIIRNSKCNLKKGSWKMRKRFARQVGEQRKERNKEKWMIFSNYFLTWRWTSCVLNHLSTCPALFLTITQSLSTNSSTPPPALHLSVTCSYHWDIIPFWNDTNVQMEQFSAFHRPRFPATSSPPLPLRLPRSLPKTLSLSVTVSL